MTDEMDPVDKVKWFHSLFGPDPQTLGREEYRKEINRIDLERIRILSGVDKESDEYRQLKANSANWDVIHTARIYRLKYESTKNPLYAWRAYQLLRECPGRC